MKFLILLEELAQTVLGILALYYQPVHMSWWLWIILFFSPDISMLGYVINTKTGAFTYNLFHHKGFAIVVAVWGFFTGNQICLLSGILLFAHSSFDRTMGYGLKYGDNFKHTHLGWLPNNKSSK